MNNKVLLLAPTPPPYGGISSWTQRMLNSKLKNNWTIDVVDEKLIGNSEIFGNNSKKNIFNEAKRFRYIWRNLKEKLLNEEINIVQACIPATTFAMIRELISCFIVHRKKRKFVIHFRCTTTSTLNGFFSRFFFRLLCKKSDCVFVLNNQSYKHVQSVCKTPIELIPNFVDSKDIVDKHPISESIKTALYVGGVIEEKGCSLICDISSEFPNIEFRMIGNAEQRIIDLAKAYNNIVITGPKNKRDVEKELESADIFLFLSFFRREGFSNSLVEAMSKGLPCIASDWAANFDMLENKGGVIVPVNSREYTIAAIKKEMDFDIRKKQSIFNIEKVKKFYSSDVVLDMYVDCYERILSR